MKRFLISTTEDMYQKIKCVSAKRGQTITGLIREILWDWIKEGATNEGKATDNNSAETKTVHK